MRSSLGRMSQPGVRLWARVLYLVLVFVKSVLIFFFYDLFFQAEGERVLGTVASRVTTSVGFATCVYVHGVFSDYSDSGDQNET
jgi:hypothetical protein